VVRPAAETVTDVPDLVALLTSGATFGGVVVQSLRIDLADGRVQKVQLPAPVTPDTDAPKDWAKTKAGAAILEVLGREGRPLKGSAIAALAKYGYNGSFRSALAGLTEQGAIDHDEDDGYRLVG
jgi:hypothetical protein